MWPFKKKRKDSGVADLIAAISEAENKNHQAGGFLSMLGGGLTGSPGSLAQRKMAAMVDSVNATADAVESYAMDGMDGFSAARLSGASFESIPAAIADWYASQGFIGYQMAAILAQHWLVNKACSMPARDATRNGYDVATENGDALPDDVDKIIQKYDKKYKVRHNCEQFVRFGRVFGVRVAYFDVESDDPLYYEKPFNIDGVAKGAYKGIVQVDPYWCTPCMSAGSVSTPASQNFYEPEHWQVGGKKIHRSHCVVYRHGDLPDILKPAYMYGGVPLPQMIMERVYTAERSASEMLGLMTSKRTTVWQTNMEMFMANQDQAMHNLSEWVRFRDNYGIKIGDKDGDSFQQFDTTLSDIDSIPMTMYQIVAAASGVPATKLLGTPPKGFNSTGEYDAKSYHEELESIQAHGLTELVERHHQLVIKSFCSEQVETMINWRPADSPTSVEIADLNNKNADFYSKLVGLGAVDGEDVRQVVAKNPDSGFADLGIDSEDDGDNENALAKFGITQADSEVINLGGSDGEKESEAIQTKH